MKWVWLAVFLNGATGTTHDAVIDMDVNKYASYEACRADALDFQKKAATNPGIPPVKIFCWRVDVENSGALAAGGFEPAKNNADSVLPIKPGAGPGWYGR